MSLTKGDGMNDATTTENTRLALQRIVALLFALAGLAERAAAAPRQIRWTVLFPLRLAEAAASSFASDCALGAPARLPASAFFQSGERPADALLLAERFRALARLLDDLCRHAFPSKVGEGRHDSRSPPSWGRWPAGQRGARRSADIECYCRVRVRPPDTS